MNILREMVSWGKSIALAIAVAVLLNVFVIQPTKVLGSSMQPTLHNEETILISKVTHTLRYEPNYNDIVIIDSRVERDRTLLDDFKENPLFSLLADEGEHDIWVKRVIGKPGDVLEFKDHKVYRNGRALDEPYTKEPMAFTSNQKVVVPEDHVFVMGDNRNNSKDSRMIGSVPIGHVLGKKLF